MPLHSTLYLTSQLLGSGMHCHEFLYGQYTPPRCRRDSTWIVELSRVGGVNAPVSCRDSISCAVELLRLVTSDDTMTSLLKKVINIDHVVKPLLSLFGQFTNCDRIRRQSSWASCELCSHRRRRHDSTRQLRRVGVGGCTIVCRQMFVWTQKEPFVESRGCGKLQKTDWISLSTDDSFKVYEVGHSLALN